MESAEAQRFWEWFTVNQAQFLFIAEVPEAEASRMRAELSERLSDYDTALGFDIHTAHQAPRLTITAHGNASKFATVRFLVEQAPTVSDWAFTALHPANGVSKAVVFEEFLVHPDRFFFKPLRNHREPEALGLRLGTDEHSGLKRIRLQSMFESVLASVLGEESFARDVHFLDPVQLPEDPEKDGYIKLERLAEFIEWKKKNIG